MTINGTKQRYGYAHLAFMFFAPPAAWGVQLLVGYGLVSVACLTGTRVAFDVLSVIVALTVLASGLTSFRSWHDRDIADLEVTSSADQFVAAVGVVLAVIFFALIAATGIYGNFLNACPPASLTLP